MTFNITIGGLTEVIINMLSSHVKFVNKTQTVYQV